MSLYHCLALSLMIAMQLPCHQSSHLHSRKDEGGSHKRRVIAYVRKRKFSKNPQRMSHYSSLARFRPNAHPQQRGRVGNVAFFGGWGGMATPIRGETVSRVSKKGLEQLVIGHGRKSVLQTVCEAPGALWLIPSEMWPDRQSPLQRGWQESVLGVRQATGSPQQSLCKRGEGVPSRWLQSHTWQEELASGVQMGFQPPLPPPCLGASGQLRTCTTVCDALQGWFCHVLCVQLFAY